MDKPEPKIFKTAQEARDYAKQITQSGYKPVRTTVRTPAGIRNHAVLVFRLK